MRGAVYSKDKKEEVRQAILDGKSYNEITALSGVPKSTISTWFGNFLVRPINHQKRMEHLKRIRELAAIKISKKWQEIRYAENKLIEEKITKEIPNYPFDNLGFYKSMLSMLYWAEGAKYEGVCGLQFVNTDPNLMKFFITLLRKCYNINEKKLRIRVHVHYYHSVKEVKNFWSQLLDIPLNQFGKIYLKKRSKTKKFRKNFMGICFVRYGDSKIRKEIIEITKKIPESVDNAPVA